MSGMPSKGLPFLELQGICTFFVYYYVVIQFGMPIAYGCQLCFLTAIFDIFAEFYDIYTHLCNLYIYT